MKSFDDELKRALSRQEPSDEFTARLLKNVATKEEQSKPANRLWTRLTSALVWSPVMAALLLFATLTVYQRHEKRMRGEAAKAQLLTAMRIASVKVHSAQQRVTRIDSEEVVVQ